jgi:hypothetical protein
MQRVQVIIFYKVLTRLKKIVKFLKINPITLNQGHHASKTHLEEQCLSLARLNKHKRYNNLAEQATVECSDVPVHIL